MSTMTPSESLPANRIASLLKQDIKPIFLLGAGASARSGIPLAGALVEQIGKWGYCKTHDRAFDDPTLMRSDWWPWLQRQSWLLTDKSLADSYPQAVEMILKPRENRKDFFKHILRPGIPPSQGYEAMARLLAQHVIRTVLTTNFDSLLVESAKSLPQIHGVVEIRTSDDFRRFSTNPQYPQIIYIHGSVDHYTDQNIETETQQLNQELVDLLKPLLRDHPLVVIGYRGAEPSVMRHLLIKQAGYCNCYRHGIYWCHRKGDVPLNGTPLLSELANVAAGNFQLVEIDGFDELMALLERSLTEGLSFTPAEGLGRVTRDVLPLSFDLEDAQVGFEGLNEVLLRTKLVAYADAVRLPRPEVHTPTGLYRAMVERSLANYRNDQYIPTNGGRLLFVHSAVHQLAQACIQIIVSGPKRWVTEVLDLQDKDELNDGEEIVSIEGDLWSQLEQASNLLARVNRPFRLKGPISQDVYPYPPLALKELLTNLLAHRDYRIASPAIIRILPSEIQFENPGGLIDHVRWQLDAQDIQTAVSAAIRGIKGYRNPVIADFFFSAGAMDKEGSGLPDVVHEATNNLNDLKFGPTKDNAAFIALVKCRPEALAIDAQTRTARAFQGELRYSPNLLMVTQWPDEVWKLGVWENDEKPTAAQRTAAPPFATYRNWLWTFTAPGDACARILADLIIQEEIHRVPTQELLEDPGGSIRVLPRILNMALARYLERLNLRVRYESNHVRAYFPAAEGQPREVTYRGLYKQATRTVAKPIRSRTTGAIIYWEHKAVALRFELLGANWCLALIPCYVFTANGDLTPLASDRIGPLSTRRASHDYNPVVLHDLVFWSRVLAGGNESTFEIPLSVSPSVDDNAPACSHPCIALSALIPTMVFQEPADANMEMAVEAEMSEVEMEELQNAIEALIEEESETGGSNDTESADR